MKEPLQLKVVYRLDLTDKIRFGSLEKDALYKRFSDGRIPGLLARDLMCDLYGNLSKSPSSDSHIMDTDKNRYKCHMVTLRGVKLLLSNQVGKGRQFNREAHLGDLKKLRAFIFMDTRKSPIFRIVAIPVGDLDEAIKLKAEQFDSLIARFPRSDYLSEDNSE